MHNSPVYWTNALNELYLINKEKKKSRKNNLEMVVVLLVLNLFDP